MNDLHEHLLSIEHALGSASADAYRRHLARDAVVIVPGAALDRDACIAAMEASPGWDERTISDARAFELAPDVAALTYRWSSRRGDQRYQALMTSVYARRAGEWRLVLHQQTPQPA